MADTSGESDDIRIEVSEHESRGQWNVLPRIGATAPVAFAALAATASAASGARKPLRGPKQPVPRAKSVNRARLLNAPAGPPIVSPAAPPALPPSVTVVSFDGGADDNTSIPPDTHAAFGPRHVFNPLNNLISVFDRAGGQLSQARLDAFWAPLGIKQGVFDPKVVYDPLERRFYFVALSDAETTHSRLLVAISQTDDPTGTWDTFAVPVDPQEQGRIWLDYPSIGFTDDKITVQLNMFTVPGNQFAGSSIYAFDKPALLAQNQTFTWQLFVLPNKGGTQVPAVTLDPAMADQYLISTWSGSSGGQGYLALWSITGSVAQNAARLNALGFLGVPATWQSYPPGDLAPQLGSATRIAVGDDRMQNVVLRNGTLHAVHTILLPAVGQPAVAGLQWYDIQVAGWATRHNRLADPSGTVHRAFPSLAVGGGGEVLIGHARFEANAHAAGAWVLTDGKGQQAQGTFAPGAASYAKTFGGSRNRWGDYSATQADPEDPVAFWTIQEYAGATPNTWRTRIARITLAQPSTT